MKALEGVNVGVAICASCCNHSKVMPFVKELMSQGANITLIASYNTQRLNSRFGKGKVFIENLEKEFNTTVLKEIPEVEPLGPKNLLDIILVAPCTGNSLAKLANAIIDTPVIMAAKSMLRNNKPVVLLLSTNDALGLNLKNIGTLINTKNVYFVPMGQDNYTTKPNSISGDFNQIVPTLEQALQGEQIQPLIITYNQD